MVKLKISMGKQGFVETLSPLFVKNELRISGEGVFHSWNTAVGDTYFLLGEIIGVRQPDGTLLSPGYVKVDTVRLETPDRIPEVEGRFAVIRVSIDGVCDVWTDQFGRVDIYWQVSSDGVEIATGLDLLPVSQTGSAPDNVGLAHSLIIYGSRPAKKHTLYKGVRRLGVDQGLRVSSSGVEILGRKFNPQRSTPVYAEQDLNRYADHFLEAIRARASSYGNIVYLSSGWDSTSILAALVHLFGNRKTRAVIGRMKYSERSGVINQFEIDRAQAVAEYFGIHLDIVELDYRDNAQETLSQLRGLFQSQQFSNLTGVNHWKLAEATARCANGEEVIFAGEMSDGAHNLGFSQFTSIFHPASQDFREYSDKMASYLFGPTFLKQMQHGVHEQDPIWQIFKQRSGEAVFDQIKSEKKDIAQQMLASFFLRGGRIPLFSIDNSRLLSLTGRELFSFESEKTYINDVAQTVTDENLYAHYLHLYNSFHWQGSTVSTLEHTAEHHGMRCVLPFHDSAVIDFLAAMPESWGRGLDLNPTKYPLKWMLRNRIDYPHHLQIGPHSYTYDVDPGFTLVGEILHASSFKPAFQQSLKEGKLFEWLDEDMFDLGYVSGLTKRYLDGEELKAGEMNDLASLAMHSSIGVYGL